MNKKTGLILSMLFFVCLFSAPVMGNDLRILIERADHPLAKYEPASGTYLGAYIEQDTLIDADIDVFNELTGKKHASFFRYVGYGTMIPQDWIDKVKAADAALHIALEPNSGLLHVKDDDYLRAIARQMNEIEGPVFLRYASEMNGNWAAYSGDPELYIEKWRLVYDVMKEEAPNVIMVWTVFTFPQRSILWYYPGDEYVDWVGVNIYNVVYHNNDINDPACHEDPLELLDHVYSLFSDRKPIQISEYAATHYTTTDDTGYVEFAVEKITRLYSGIAEMYPRVKAIFYFNTNNLINAPAGRRINNYSLTSSHRVLEAYAKVISDKHFLSDMAPDNEGYLTREYFTLYDGYFLQDGTTYISKDTVRQWFGLSLDNETGYFPIRYIADIAGYHIHYCGDNHLIRLCIADR